METQWIKVDNSSLISGYKYVKEKQTLYVEFKSNKAMYAYFDVPEKLIQSIDLENPGRYIHEKIIKAGFKYRRTL